MNQTIGTCLENTSIVQRYHVRISMIACLEMVMPHWQISKVCSEQKGIQIQISNLGICSEVGVLLTPSSVKEVIFDWLHSTWGAFENAILQKLLVSDRLAEKHHWVVYNCSISSSPIMNRSKTKHLYISRGEAPGNSPGHLTNVWMSGAKTNESPPQQTFKKLGFVAFVSTWKVSIAEVGAVQAERVDHPVAHQPSHAEGRSRCTDNFGERDRSRE